MHPDGIQGTFRDEVIVYRLIMLSVGLVVGIGIGFLLGWLVL